VTENEDGGKVLIEAYGLPAGTIIRWKGGAYRCGSTVHLIVEAEEVSIDAAAPRQYPVARLRIEGRPFATIRTNPARVVELKQTEAGPAEVILPAEGVEFANSEHELLFTGGAGEGKYFKRRFKTTPLDVHEASLLHRALRGDIASVAEFLERRKIDPAWAPAHEAFLSDETIALLQEATAAAFYELDRWDEVIGGGVEGPELEVSGGEEEWPDVLEEVHL
jgi:hypothetical protein